MNFPDVTNTIIKFIRLNVKMSHSNGIVLGLSGGLDSSVAATLAVKALGSESVLSLIIPDYGVSLKNDIQDSINLARKLNMKYKIIDITHIKSGYVKFLPKNKIAIGNLTARIRMNIIYYYSNIYNKLVLGPSDKSEILLGYFTKYGDGGADIFPLGDLYKTQVRNLGSYLQLSPQILSKKSSPRLWKGQTAEGEIGMTYDLIDLILKDLIKNETLGTKISNKFFEARTYKKKDFVKIKKLVEINKHKRNPPTICKISSFD
ncbi:MAG: NAD+ synthase [Nitrososphaeraceae archaeon]